MKKSKWATFSFLAVLVPAISSNQAYGTAEAAGWPRPLGHLDEVVRHYAPTFLRSDLDEMLFSGNYYTRFKAAQYTQGATGNEYTHASLVLNIQPCEQGDFNLMCSTINVGLLATRNQVRWFVYSRDFEINQTIECMRGTRMWAEDDLEGHTGCLGNNQDIVSLNTWHGVRFVKQSNDRWDVQVEDKNRKSYVVAIVRNSGAGELQSIQSTYESSDGSKYNPLLGGFWHDMPYYRKDGEMHKWPASDLSDEYNGLGEARSRNTAWAGSTDEFQEEGVPCPKEMAVKDQITPNGGSWYTGKPLGKKQGFTCYRDPLF